MALTSSAWTTTTVDGQKISTCTVIVGAGTERDAYTLPIAAATALSDARLPWRLIFHSLVAGDGQALPLILHVGYSASFALSAENPVVTTDGAIFKQIYDDVRPAVTEALALSWQMNPVATHDLADVVTTTNNPGRIAVPVAPYYAFNLDGGSALVATTHTFIIIQ